LRDVVGRPDEDGISGVGTVVSDLERQYLGRCATLE
jgi:hypothetical protein